MYKLRAELRIHSADVRDVAASSAGLIATASRDNSVVLWNLQQRAPRAVLKGHTHFVNSLAFVGTNRLVSASADNTLRVWNTETAECIQVLEGHTASVCSVTSVDEASTIVSASWDMTARVWSVDSADCERVLRGHEAAVWAATQTSRGTFVTVGADKKVRLWPGQTKSETGIALQMAHSDVVRDIVTGPNAGFVTVANDSALVYWREARDSYLPLKKISNLHDGSYCYSVDSFADGLGKWLFATGGEDNALRVSECDESSVHEITTTQTIVHPGTVWAVCFCPNGDIVSACSDGVARVFTTDAALFADQDVLASFEKAVSQRQINTKVIGGVDMSKLPPVESALAAPGKKDGENKIVKTANGGAEVHMWSAADHKWSKVGDVVDEPSGGGATSGGEVKGKKYDFVFEVEIGEGGKKEKLGFNKGENPYLAAQRFIDDNEISQEFLDQIAHFIEQQVPPGALQPTGPQVSDPFTGKSRYVPGSGSASSTANSDPLTGGSRYVPASNGRLSSAASDPFTGGSRYVPGGGSNVGSSDVNKLPPPRKLIPHKTGMVLYKSIDQIERIQQKLSLFNTEFAKDGAEQALNQEEATVFGSSLLPKLKSRKETIVLDDEDCAVVEKLLKWPTTHSFPVLDVARIAVSLPSGAAYFFGKRNGAVLSDVLAHLSSEKANGAVYIMGCRFLCNMFGNRVAGAVAKSERSKILEAAANAAKNDNKRARETFASLLVNYAVMLHDSEAPAKERSPVMQRAIEIIQAGEVHEEVVYRVMVAAGTLICDDMESAALGVEMGIAKAAADVAPISPRVQEIALEIATIIAR